MQADAVSQSGPNVTGAIQKAAQLTGANFDYLVSAAKAESNLDPGAAAPSSSAGGLFQFIEQTWLATLKQAGALFGYGTYANAISATPSGTYVVSDPKMQQAVMQLRNDPTANSVMAGVFTNQNAAKLAAEIGRPPSEGELYIAHFLGAAGAAKLIGTAATQPSTSAVALFPAAARSNPTIFYDQQGNARSAGQVYSLLIGRFTAAHARAAAPAAVAAVPDTAGTLAAISQADDGPDVAPIVADDGQVFHTLFRTGDRAQPVAALVNQLWSSPQGAGTATAAAPATPASAAASASAVQTVPVGATTGTSQPGVGGTSLLGLFQTGTPSAQGLFDRGGS